MKSVMRMIVPIAIGMALVVGCSTDNILSPADQLKKDVATIDKYLDKNGIVATKDPSGLRLVVDDAGAGLFPGIDAKLTVSYTGTFLNGGVFSQTTTPETFTTPLSGLISGWQIAFGKYVAKGGKATLYIPSGLAYGAAGRSSIPGNANLVFVVQLIGYTN